MDWGGLTTCNAIQLTQLLNKGGFKVSFLVRANVNGKTKRSSSTFATVEKQELKKLLTTLKTMALMVQYAILHPQPFPLLQAFYHIWTRPLKYTSISSSLVSEIVFFCNAQICKVWLERAVMHACIPSFGGLMGQLVEKALTGSLYNILSWILAWKVLPLCLMINVSSSCFVDSRETSWWRSVIFWDLGKPSLNFCLNGFIVQGFSTQFPESPNSAHLTFLLNQTHLIEVISWLIETQDRYSAPASHVGWPWFESCSDCVTKTL